MILTVTHLPSNGDFTMIRVRYATHTNTENTSSHSISTGGNLLLLLLLILVSCIQVVFHFCHRYVRTRCLILKEKLYHKIVLPAQRSASEDLQLNHIIIRVNYTRKLLQEVKACDRVIEPLTSACEFLRSSL